jgi:chemotaxis protein methyltransferase CheR
VSSILPHPEELLCDQDFLRLKEYLIRSTGLSYYADKEADLARRIHRRLSSFGAQDCGLYLEALRDPRRGPSELDALIPEITIGETYFFRHREHFDALRDVILPELIARKAGIRRLRIWCAGCADGAEPYSLSILLRRELGQLLAGWEITILGTDINRQDLEIAQEGKFEEWSLRSTSEDIRQACFHKDGRLWRIASDYKKGVSFQFHNLVASPTSPPLQPATFDLIVCRNVMIYFASELMQRTVSQFHECLAPGAWLLVGPSEPNMSHFRAFRAVNAPGVTLYQKSAEPAPESGDIFASATRLLPCVPVLPSIPVCTDSGLPISDLPSGSSAPLLEALRECADRGEWDDAVGCCKALLEADSLNPSVHFHYALVLEQLGNHADAEGSLRRAIYLDRQSIQAHYHLALLLRSRGDLRPARRSFDNTLGLLEFQRDDEILIDGDGVTVAKLKKLVRSQMEALGEQI